MKSLKEVLLNDIQIFLLAIVGGVAAIVLAGVPLLVVQFTGNSAWFWIYVPNVICLYAFTVKWRMERN